jgi:N6-adenosine-specific RNA methylase IME4
MYDVILADPPWSYYGQQDKWGAAAKFYDTMTDHEILSLDVRGRLNSPGLVFLWATSPRLDFALECLSEWGLFYRGVGFVWVKTKKDGTPIGAQGVRPSVVKPLTEFVLVGSTKQSGRPLPLWDESVCQTVFAPKREHSHKPDEVQERIERMYPSASKLVMFSRRERFGWDSTGLETDGVDLR